MTQKPAWYKRPVPWLIAVNVLLWGLIIFVPVPKDNTDPVNGRSGIGLHTDCLTGLQYLSSRRGGITPRLDVDGKHIIDRTGCDA